jgi:glutathione S-transferase
MRLYIDPVSTSCRAVVATVHALGLELERVDLSLMRGEHLAPSFRAVSPAGKVPVLVDRDFTLTESAAILRYLCDLTGSPLGGRGDQGRARVNEALHWFSSTIAVHFCQGLVYPRLLPHFRYDDPAVAAATRERAEAGAEAALDHLNGRILQSRPYVAGDELTIADFVGMGMLSIGEMIGFSFDDWPEVKDWMALVSAAPGWSALDREIRLLMVPPAER